jgi:sensor histidine kinase YesM
MSLGRRLLIAAAVWAGATVLFSALLYASYLGVGKPVGYVVWITAVRCAVWGLALPLLAQAARRFPVHQGNWLRQCARLLLVALLVAPAVAVAQMSIVYWTYFPYRASVPTLGTAIGNGWVNFASELPVGIALLIALQAWRVLDDFRAERTRTLQLERQLALSRLDALRMQLQPHFLFNSLHTIAGLIGEEPATARRMVVALGDLLRLTLHDAPNGARSLAQELEFVDLYMDVLKFRLGDRLALEYQIEPVATRAEVPSLLLQPLFENAVRHGASRVAGRCAIAFRAWRADGRLCLSLENDGPPPAAQAGTNVKPSIASSASAPSLAASAASTASAASVPGGGVGLTNTLARLRLQYGEEFSFHYTARPAGGARVDLSLPYRSVMSDEEEEEADADRAAGARAAR